jgi:hypothetical protein
MVLMPEESKDRMAELTPPEVALLVASALENIGVPYLIGGSLASITHGMIRSTMDAGLVADLHPEQISAFVHVLRDEFYVDPMSIFDAIQHRSSFNLIIVKLMPKKSSFNGS